MTRDATTNHSALSTRATALQREIEAAFQAPSKRTLKHTEAMDILARVDGFRNREAAHAVANGPRPANQSDADKTNEARGTFDPNSEWFEFRIPFHDGMGFLGAKTNGAPPQSVDGILVACDASASAEKVADPDWLEEEAAGIWLRATADDEVHNFAYMSGWKQAKTFLAMIIEAEHHGFTGTMLGVTAYANEAQFDFDEDTAEGPDEDVRFTCKPTQGGFQLEGTSTIQRKIGQSLRPGTSDGYPTIVRLEGSLGKRGLHELAKRLQEAEAWFRKRRMARQANRHAEEKTS